MTKKQKRKKPIEYKVRVELYGIPAYAIDTLLKTGLFGTTRKKVLETIISNWTFKELNSLGDLGVNLEEARRKGYIPIKRREYKL